MLTDNPTSVNPMLREAEAITKEVAKLLAQRKGIENSISRLRGKVYAIDEKISPLEARAAKLIAAADTLEDDWREWPWVKEAGLHTLFPKENNGKA